MRLHFISPYTFDKRLGEAYNEACSRIPNGDWICITDHDVMMFGNIGHQIMNVINQINESDKDKLLTCVTNRIGTKQQLLEGIHIPHLEADIAYHAFVAKTLSISNTPIVTEISTCSGMLMVFKKSTWEKVKFIEDEAFLGVDTEFAKGVRALPYGQILRMNRIYVYHYYRLLEGIKNTSHLKV